MKLKKQKFVLIVILLFGGVLLSFISPKPSKGHWFYNEKRQLKADTNLYLDKRIPNSFFEDGLSVLYFEIFPYVIATEPIINSGVRDTVIFRIGIERIGGSKYYGQINSVTIVGVPCPYSGYYAELCNSLRKNMVGSKIHFPCGSEESDCYLYLPIRIEIDLLDEDKFEPSYSKSIENGYLVVRANAKLYINN